MSARASSSGWRWLPELHALLSGSPIGTACTEALIRKGLLGGLASSWHARDGAMLPATNCLHMLLQGPMQLQQGRGYAKAAKPASKSAAAPAPAKKAAAADPKLSTPLPKLHWVYKRPVSGDKGPTALLTKEQKEAVEQLTGTAASETNPEGLVSFKQMGVPFTPRDTLQLMHESFSRTMGEDVQLRPFVYSNVFQSAPGTAQYVASALEAGAAWSRIERFFLACMEEDKTVAAIKVQVKGRMGRKADMARKQVLEQGSLKLGHIGLPVDYGQAQALTRQGVLGVKVWIRYKPGLASQAMVHKSPATPEMPLATLLSMPRTLLPKSASAWWSAPGPEQPLANRTWQPFAPDYSPTSTDVAAYVVAQQPVLFNSNRERLRHLAKTLYADKQTDTGGQQPAT